MAAIFGPEPNVTATFGTGPKVASVQLISSIHNIFLILHAILVT